MKYIASRIVIASDIGLNNNLFGPKLLEWIDSYASLFTYKYLHHKFVTYKMEKTYFLKPAKEEDCLDFYASNIKFNSVSVNFNLVAKINSCNPPKEIINTNMTFVAIDINSGKPTKLNPFLFEQDMFEKCIKQKMLEHMPEDLNIFHNQKHIEDMLTQLNMYKALFNPLEYKRIYAAICYHDVVHIPGNTDNEEKSIALLKRDLGKAISETDLEQISKLILCTKTNYSYEDIKKVKYADLLHDLDMISFIDYDTMTANDVKIKTEYSAITPLDFYKYKLKYFDRLINEGVFISSQYKKYNSIAIENIKRYTKEIEELIRKNGRIR